MPEDQEVLGWVRIDDEGQDLAVVLRKLREMWGEVCYPEQRKPTVAIRIFKQVAEFSRHSIVWPRSVPVGDPRPMRELNAAQLLGGLQLTEYLPIFSPATEANAYLNIAEVRG